MNKLYKNRSTTETKAYWDMADKVAKEVAKWPKWKRDIKVGYSYSTNTDSISLSKRQK